MPSYGQSGKWLLNETTIRAGRRLDTFRFAAFFPLEFIFPFRGLIRAATHSYRRQQFCKQQTRWIGERKAYDTLSVVRHKLHHLSTQL